MSPDAPLSYRPASHYWRVAAETATPEQLTAYVAALIHDLERHKAALRDLGHMPPKTYWAPGELLAKHGHDPRPGLPTPCGIASRAEAK